MSTPTDPQQFVDALLSVSAENQADWLRQNRDPLNAANFSEIVFVLLKDETEKWLRISVSKCQAVIDTMQRVVAITQQPQHRGLTMLAQGNLNALGRGEYPQALIALTEASSAFQEAGLVVEQARVVIPKVATLAWMGDYDQAARDGEWARNIFIEHNEYEKLAILTLNLSTMLYMRRGDDHTALQLLEESADLIRQHLSEDHVYLVWIQHNQATSYRNLGRFNDAISASTGAIAGLIEAGHSAEAIRAKQNLAITYFVIGRYNEALQIFEEVKTFWLADGRQRDAVLVELFVSDGLLSLYRFNDVIEKSRFVRERFTELGVQGEVAQAAVNQARAHVGLAQYDEALLALKEAERIYQAEDNELATYIIQLERAVILERQQAFGASIAIVEQCIGYFEDANLPNLVTMARLVLAQIGLAQADLHLTDTQLSTIDLSDPIPAVAYRANLLRGDWYAAEGELQAALTAYDAAMDVVEVMKGRLMVEFRVIFADYTVTVYEKATALCIESGQFERALRYAERAKSRALLDLIAYRLDLSIQAHQEADQPIVDELMRLRQERDRLYRLLGSNENLRVADTQLYDPFWRETREQIVAYEQQITTLWHQLLIRNADYARDASLWQVNIVPVQPLLPENTLLLEYFEVDGALVVFQVTNTQIEATQLSTDIAQIDHWIQFFKMNCERLTPNKNRPKLLAALHKQALGILNQLYNHILAPLAVNLQGYDHLIIVPHGTLHHLPFHALYDGTHHLIEKHIINYLPNATLLNHIQPQVGDGSFVAFGYSNAEQLPYTIQEVNRISELMDGTVYLDEAATLDCFYEASHDATVLHLATHGEFNPANPLFSGVTLADGQLVTMDIFNLELSASLVTLSACQTGRHVISQGDELLGLMRGFLSAGAASLVLSHWSVEDRSTALLMEQLYSALRDDMTKGAALRDAQLRFIQGNIDTSAEMRLAYAHPYFWAPFFLIGDAGRL